MRATTAARFGLALAAACASLPAPAETFTLFATGHFQLRRGDAVVEGARIYRADGVPHLAIAADALGGGVLLLAGERRVVALADGAMTPAGDDADGVRVDTDLRSDRSAALDFEEGRLAFTWGDDRFYVEERDPIVGAVTAEEILAALPEYRRNAAAYEPNPGTIRLLERSLSAPVEMEVFFGSWCPHCERFVPRLLKVRDVLGPDRLQVRFHGVPHDFTNYPPAREAGVGEIPYGVIRRDGGTLVLHGDGWKAPERALAVLLLDE